MKKVFAEIGDLIIESIVVIAIIGFVSVIVATSGPADTAINDVFNQAVEEVTSELE